MEVSPLLAQSLAAPRIDSSGGFGSMAPAGSDFGRLFAEQLGSVNAQLVKAEHGLRELAAGEASNLHQVMINLEEARLAMQLLVQVRNRVLEAYQDIIRMQV